MEKKKIDGLSFEESGLSEEGWEILMKWHAIRLRYVSSGDAEAFKRDRQAFNDGLDDSAYTDRLVKFLAMISKRHEIK